MEDSAGPPARTEKHAPHRTLELTLHNATDLPDLTTSALCVRRGVVIEMEPGYLIVFEALGVTVLTGPPPGKTRLLKLRFPPTPAPPAYYHIKPYSISPVYIGPFHSAEKNTQGWRLLKGHPYWNGHIFPIAKGPAEISLSSAQQIIWILDGATLLVGPHDKETLRTRISRLPPGAQEPSFYPIEASHAPWLKPHDSLPLVCAGPNGTSFTETPQGATAYSPQLNLLLHSTPAYPSPDAPAFQQRPGFPHLTLPIPQYTLLEKNGAYILWADVGHYPTLPPPPPIHERPAPSPWRPRPLARYPTRPGRYLAAAAGADGITRGFSTAPMSYNLPGLSLWASTEWAAFKLHVPTAEITWIWTDGTRTPECLVADGNAPDNTPSFAEPQGAAPDTPSAYYCASRHLTLPPELGPGDAGAWTTLCYSPSTNEGLHTRAGLARFTHGPSPDDREISLPEGKHAFRGPDGTLCHVLPRTAYCRKVMLAAPSVDSHACDAPLVSESPEGPHLGIAYETHGGRPHPVMKWRPYAPPRADPAPPPSTFLSHPFPGPPPPPTDITFFVHTPRAEIEKTELLRRPLLVYEGALADHPKATPTTHQLRHGRTYTFIGTTHCALARIRIEHAPELTRSPYPTGARRDREGWIVALPRPTQPTEDPAHIKIVWRADNPPPPRKIAGAPPPQRTRLFGTRLASSEHSWRGPALYYGGWHYPLASTHPSTCTIAALPLPYSATLPGAPLEELLGDPDQTHVCPAGMRPAVESPDANINFHAASIRLESPTTVLLPGILKLNHAYGTCSGDNLGGPELSLGPSEEEPRLLVLQYADWHLYLYIEAKDPRPHTIYIV